ncbi:helix-turn-helix domain-containing protein [Mammaliicoccus sciuri]|uniref:helix-turn-helix domain-containing protein n=1 Tax=Mammaliicoccus sp. P-M57 TaxID=2898716 RepID=UPI00195287CC|nr:helix-turn-helix transcriptional regulator [Mammaliicoccus sp. P-M57]
MKNNLSLLLGIRRMSVIKLSKETKIASSTLYNLYHCNTDNPDTKTVMKLCEYFDITPNDFFDINNKEDSDNAKNKTTTITN